MNKYIASAIALGGITIGSGIYASAASQPNIDLKFKNIQSTAYPDRQVGLKSSIKHLKAQIHTDNIRVPFEPFRGVKNPISPKNDPHFIESLMKSRNFHLEETKAYNVIPERAPGPSHIRSGRGERKTTNLDRNLEDILYSYLGIPLRSVSLSHIREGNSNVRGTSAPIIGPLGMMVGYEKISNYKKNKVYFKIDLDLTKLFQF